MILKQTMTTSVQLPQWLDNLIFEQLGAKYCRTNDDMTVIDWNKSDVLNYLGTYFPRSYAESYCIFSEFLRQYPSTFAGKTDICIFDFGCGTAPQKCFILPEVSQRDYRFSITVVIIFYLAAAIIPDAVYTVDRILKCTLLSVIRFDPDKHIKQVLIIARTVSAVRNKRHILFPDDQRSLVSSVIVIWIEREITEVFIS